MENGRGFLRSGLATSNIGLNSVGAILYTLVTGKIYADEPLTKFKTNGSLRNFIKKLLKNEFETLDEFYDYANQFTFSYFVAPEDG